MKRNECIGCGSKEDLSIYYDGYYSLEWDEENQVHIAKVDSENELHVLCSACDKTQPIENFEVVYEREKRAKRENRIKANIAVISIFVGIMIADGEVVTENLIALHVIVERLAEEFEVEWEKNPEKDNFEGIEEFSKKGIRTYYGI